MRMTDDRYRGEQAKFELAMRMLGFEARTGTIRYWTGLSDDRIRKLYSSYFKYGGEKVRRQRGRSPSQIGPLVRNANRALESGVLANLLFVNGLIDRARPGQPQLRSNIDLGHRFCDSFETYRALVPRAALSFEWSWNLLVSMRSGDELGIVRCSSCAICYVIDRLSLPRGPCPGCLAMSD
jgi:hypothetical protein